MNKLTGFRMSLFGHFRWPLLGKVNRRPVPFLQLGPVDCGPANLMGLARYFDIQVSLANLRVKCGATGAGVNIFGLGKASYDIGLRAETIPMDLYDLRDAGPNFLPAIVALESGGSLLHFITIYGFKKNKAQIMDPQVGLMMMDIDELSTRVYRQGMVIPTSSIREVEESTENRDEILVKLGSLGVPRRMAETWLRENRSFHLDDCIKFVEYMKRDQGGRWTDSKWLLHGLLETRTLKLPEHFDSSVFSVVSSEYSCLKSPLVLVISGPLNSTLQTARPKTSSRKRLIRLALRYWRFWWRFTFVSIALVVLRVLIPLTMGLVVESLEKGWPPLIWVIGGVALGRVTVAIFNSIDVVGANRARNAIGLRLNSGLLSKFQRIPGKLLMYRRTGELMSRVDEGAAIPRFVVSWPVRLVSSSFSLVLSVGIIAYQWWPVLAVLLAGAAASALVSEFFNVRVRRLGRDVLESMATYNSHFSEMLRGLETIRLVEASQAWFRDSRELARAMIRTSFRRDDWGLVSQAVSAPFQALVTLGLSIVAYFGLNGGFATPGVIVSSIALAAQARAAVSSLIRLRKEIEENRIVLERLEEFLEVPDENELLDDSSPLKHCENWQEFRASGICYEYDSGRSILPGIDLVVKPGEKICLRGPSGVGKTTLLDILAGIKTPDTGILAVDERPLESQNFRIVLIDQEPVILDGTIRENILFGEGNSSPFDIETLCEIACLDEVVASFPEGLDHGIAGQRMALSGGEARRLSLVRALVRSPHVLLMDETLSSVDWGMRRRIVRNLSVRFPDLAIVIASHDKTDAALCDRVIILENRMDKGVDLGHSDLERSAGVGDRKSVVL